MYIPPSPWRVHTGINDPAHVKQIMDIMELMRKVEHNESLPDESMREAKRKA